MQSNSIQVFPETYTAIQVRELVIDDKNRDQATGSRAVGIETNQRGYKGARIKNVNIREELQVRPLLEEIERNKLRWLSHVKGMDTEKKLRKFLEWRPPVKRPTDRPRKRRTGVEKAHKRRGTSLREIEESRMYERRED